MIRKDKRPKAAEKGKSAKKEVAEAVTEKPVIAAEKEQAETEKLLEEIEDIKSQVEKLKDDLLRSRAETENTRKRIEKQKRDEIKYASLPLIRDLLGVIDNLELALKYADKDDPLREGVSMALDGMKKVLECHHLATVKAIGEKFDPSLHEAVSIHSDSDIENDVIIEEQKVGYKLHDRVVRASVVVVNRVQQKPEDKEETAKESMEGGGKTIEIET